MSIDTIYVMAGGDYFQSAFNGIVTLLGSNSWASMFRIVGLVAAMTLFATYIKGHDPLEVIKFMAFFILITSVLLIPKRTVQIIDLTNSTGVYRVDNVPVGLSAPMKFITGIGASVTKAYESIFHTPDAITYSKTGMLFGANLVGNASDIFSRNADLSALMGDYVRQCVIGDIMLNNKYTLQELMSSSDPYTLIFKKPSPLRGVIVPYGNKEATAGFQACESLAKNVLIPKLGLDTKDGGKTWDYYVRSFFGGKPNADVLFANMLGDSYNFFYKGGKSASEIMRNNVVMSSIRQGFSGYAANSGDAASLINLASNSSYSKMRLSWGASSTIATTFLPVMHTVLMAMLVGLFPIIILLAMIHTLTMPMLKNFVFTLLYLQMWPPLFAILNYVMSYYLQGQTKEMDFSLLNVAYIQQMHSDIGLMAGWLTLSIPFIAAGVVSGLWRVVSQAGNYLGTATNSSASSSASQAADGTWAFNNMQMDNVAGQKWDTNQSFRTGQQTTQHASGAMSVQTQSGETVYDSSTAQSKLPTDIQFSKALSSGYQAQAREAMSQVQSLTQSMGQSSSLASSQMAQWSQQRGNSDTHTTGTDSSRSSNFTDAVNKLNSITARHAKDNNISQAESLQAGVTKSQSGNFSVGGQVHAKVDTDKQIIGKLAQLGTGWSVGAEAHVKGDYTGSSGSSHGIQSDTSNRTSYSKDYSAQDLKDIRQATDVIASYRTTEGSSHSQNESGSLANQMSSTFSNLQSQSTQYNDAQNRSHEYAQMATYAENNSTSINSNYAQEFVGYVRSYNGARADELLTNTSSPTVRAEREQLAQQFVEKKLKPQLEQQFQENRGRSNDGMGGVTPSSNTQSNLSGDFAQQQRGMAQAATEAGVVQAGGTVRKVEENHQNATQQIDNAAQLVADSRQGVAKESAALQKDHQSSGDIYSQAHTKEMAEQYPDNLSGVRWNNDEKEKALAELKERLHKMRGGK